ncbi:Cytosolic carboxypeptidase 2 [Podochytrium sp. JEL0797]|nr:Cytosolic carboxypeptidase 2 [Podochytrium sp. JEL0797]
MKQFLSGSLNSESDDDSDSEDSDCEDDFEEEKYMEMLAQFAEMQGISFSTGFLNQFEQSAVDSNGSLDPTFRESNESMDDSPIHKKRLPKSYRPNIGNPRPLSTNDGPASPIWPPFIKDIVDAPLLDRSESLSKEMFNVFDSTNPVSPAPVTSPQSAFIPVTVYDAPYSIQPSAEPIQPPSPAAPTIPLPPSPRESFKIPPLHFESRFECGNLAKAVRKGPSHYELYCRNDLNTAGHTQWYFFSISGMVTRDEDSYELITYRFDIVNLSKPKTLYSNGLRPLMYSEKEKSNSGIGWHRTGTNLQYYPTPRTPTDDFPESSPLPPKYTLSFTLQFKHHFDTCHLSHCFPYSYTNLQTDIQSLKTDPTRAPLFRHSILAKSVAGNNIDLLTITKPVTAPQDLVARKGIILSARVHPGETNASWMMRGLILYLTGPSPHAEDLRARFVIKIVPMMNPDGVIVGNYRCNLTGFDLNRQWGVAMGNGGAKRAVPEVTAMYELVERSVGMREVVMFCDFHGHNRKNGIFMYGCENEPVVLPVGKRKAASSKRKASVGFGSANSSSTAVGGGRRTGSMTQTTIRINSKGSQSSVSTSTSSATRTSTTTSSPSVSQSTSASTSPASSQTSVTAAPPAPPPTIPATRLAERVFPYILSQTSPDLFFFRRCQFKIQPSKRGTGRICVRQRFGIVNSFTIESSFCGTDMGVKEGGGGWQYGMRDLERLGEGFGKSLWEYFCCEGKREVIHAGLLDGFGRKDATFLPDESDDSETTSDDEVLRIKIPSKKVLTKRVMSSIDRSAKPIAKKPVVSEKPARVGVRPPPPNAAVTSPASAAVRPFSAPKESIRLSKVKVIEKRPSETFKVGSSISPVHHPKQPPSETIRPIQPTRITSIIQPEAPPQWHHSQDAYKHVTSQYIASHSSATTKAGWIKRGAGDGKNSEAAEPPKPNIQTLSLKVSHEKLAMHHARVKAKKGKTPTETPAETPGGTPTETRPDAPTYIFAYGSLINRASLQRTIGPAAIGSPQACVIKGFSRAWGYRCASKKYTAVSIAEDAAARVNGVLIEIHAAALPNLDLREKDYLRARLCASSIEHRYDTVNLKDNAVIWAYVLPTAEHTACKNIPIPQSYIDCIMEGALKEHGIAFAEDFIHLTDGWAGAHWINDRNAIAPIRRYVPNAQAGEPETCKTVIKIVDSLLLSMVPAAFGNRVQV